MDVADLTLAGAAVNLGLKDRYEFSKESGIIEVAGPICCDAFFSEWLLLSQVDLKVVRNPSSHKFCLMQSVANADFKVKLIDAYLKVRKVKVNPGVSLAHEAVLKKGRRAIYPIQRVECKSFVIPGGNPSVKKEYFRWI